MIIVGLTGSIGMGKTFVADLFREHQIPVFDADNEIHKLMEPSGEAIVPVSRQFPEVIAKNGGIDRAKLGNIVFADNNKLKLLESILHPMVRKKGDDFFKKAEYNGTDIIIQDIPLLYETGADKDCHFVIVVTTDQITQKKRVLERADMTDEKYQQILKLQLLSKEKEEKADFVISTSCEKDKVEQNVKEIINKLRRHC